MIKVLSNEICFSNVVLEEEPLTKHKQTCEKWKHPPTANEKLLISKTSGCYYLDTGAAGTVSRE